MNALLCGIFGLLGIFNLAQEIISVILAARL